MKVDVHVHIIANAPGHGKVSGYLRRRPNVVLSRLLLGIPLTGSDDKVDEIKGTRETRISGDNVGEFRKRVQRIRGDSS